MGDLLQIVDDDALNTIQLKIKSKCLAFKKLDHGSKAKVSDELFTQNQLLIETGHIVVDLIGEQDEELEFRNLKFCTLEGELRKAKSYDEEGINAIMDRNPVLITNRKIRAKKSLQAYLKRIKKNSKWSYAHL